MTGTAKTEEEEFRTIYGLDVLEIPTNKPVQIRNSTRLTTEKYVNITANQIARIMTVAAIPALKNLSLHFISTLILSIRTPFTDYIFRFNYITRTI